MKWLARAILTLCLAGSLALTVGTGLRLAAEPGLKPLRERTAAEIVAVTDRMMAQEATAERLAVLITERLAETPRNWITLEALREVVDQRGLVLPAGVLAAYDAAHAEDFSLTATAERCAACAWDIGECSLSNVLICKAPLMLTPIEDLRGISKAGWDYSTGADVDELDLGLSVLGLGATGLVLFTAGTSEAVKAGATTVKLARGMKVLSPGLERVVGDAVTGGLDLRAISFADEGLDLSKAVKMKAFEPVVEIAQDVTRMGKAVGPSATLHLMRYVDDAAEARQMARATEALGVKTVARAEVLGPARLMRATMRVSETALQLVAGLVALFWSAAAMLGGMVQSMGLRMLRRLAR